MSKPIRAYWHGRGGATRIYNFGDDLTPLIIEAVTGREVVFGNARRREPCDVIGIGSLLQWIPTNFPGAIWGTGYIKKLSKDRPFPNARVLAARGKITRSRLRASKAILGDGGLLVGDLVPHTREKEALLGVIPHRVHRSHKLVKKLCATAGALFIDVCSPPLEVVKKAQRCELLVSSSLHGLILGDALGIPNKLISVDGNKGLMGGPFKFKDYYTVYGQRSTPIPLQRATTAKILSLKIGVYRRPNIENLKEGLRKVLAEL